MQGSQSKSVDNGVCRPSVRTFVHTTRHSATRWLYEQCRFHIHDFKVIMQRVRARVLYKSLH
jgi:hypothetical protein